MGVTEHARGQYEDKLKLLRHFQQLDVPVICLWENQCITAGLTKRMPSRPFQSLLPNNGKYVRLGGGLHTRTVDLTVNAEETSKINCLVLLTSQQPGN
jgi:hypothetical protein